MIEYKFNETTNVLTISNSYKISKKDFQKVLDYCKSENKDAKIFNRTDRSLKAEWAVHNFLYNINYKRNQTKDVDLDYPCDKPEWVYKILGSLVWLFIK